jgi:hypothetical protein
VRLRRLVPRGGRGRSLGGLAAAVAAVALVLVVLTGDDERPPPRPVPTSTPITTPTPTPERARLDAPARGPSLAVGITEPNPNLFAPDEVLAMPEPWRTWRDELVRIEPELYRLIIDWNKHQPSPDAPPDLGAPNGGCMRDKPPCAPYAGVRDQLRALAARQREGGWQALVVFTGTPEWAAVAPHGCRSTEEGGARAPRDMKAYRELVSGVLDLADAEGAELRYLTPWNEANHPYFISPQRQACDAAAPSRAIAPYARLTRALRAELAEHGGDHTLVLGELAGLLEPNSRATSVPEMIRGLPRELVCAAPVWSQHAYIGGTDPVSTMTSALASRRCPRRHAIWITETGVGPAPGGFSLARGITGEPQGCRLLHRRLRDWHANPRVTLAVQYTMREDDLFPTGLITTDLARARPALKEWQAWGGREDPGARPPRSTCPAGG